jgi:hypothetical protein
MLPFAQLQECLDAEYKAMKDAASSPSRQVKLVQKSFLLVQKFKYWYISTNTDAAPPLISATPRSRGTLKTASPGAKKNGGRKATAASGRSVYYSVYLRY